MSISTSVKWNTPDGHSPLCVFFNMIHPISKEIMECIDRDSFPVHLAKGSFLARPATPNNDLYFVVKGVIRGYIVEGRKQITTWINEENEVVGSIRNLRLPTDSEEYVEAIEESELINIPDTLITYLYDNFIEANIIGRKLLEENYRGAEERAYICRIPNAKRRYEHFLETRGSLINRIPLKYIASYLGMTMETLSRIRSKMK